MSVLLGLHTRNCLECVVLFFVVGIGSNIDPFSVYFVSKRTSTKAASLNLVDRVLLLFNRVESITLLHFDGYNLYYLLVVLLLRVRSRRP